MEFLTRFPLEHMWRFFIDGWRQTTVLQFDEAEPNYISRCLAAFYFACSVPNTHRPNAQFLRDIHHFALGNVHNVSKGEDTHNTLGRFYYENVTFSISTQWNLTHNGLQEIIEHNASILPIERRYEIAHFPPDIARKVLAEKSDFIGRVRSVNRAEGLDRHIDFVIARYNLSIENIIASKDSIAEKEDRALTALVIMIAELERTHPFCDGNTRTICMVFLHSELIRLASLYGFNFVPSITVDPNRFDGWSISELKQLVTVGMLRTLEIKDANQRGEQSPTLAYSNGTNVRTETSLHEKFTALTQSLLGLALIPPSAFTSKLYEIHLTQLQNFWKRYPIYETLSKSIIEEIFLLKRITYPWSKRPITPPELDTSREDE